MQITSELTDSAVLEELGSRLRRTRLERNLSQARLAEEAGIGRVTLQRIEEGGRASLISLIRALRALELLDGLERLVPEPMESPLEELKRRGRHRQRAGSPRSNEARKDASGRWRWGNEVEAED